MGLRHDSVSQRSCRTRSARLYVLPQAAAGDPTGSALSSVYSRIVTERTTRCQAPPQFPRKKSKQNCRCCQNGGFSPPRSLSPLFRGMMLPRKAPTWPACQRDVTAQRTTSIFWCRAAGHAGTSPRLWSARLGRQNQPHNPQAHLGCSRRQPHRDRRFHSPPTPRRLRVIWPNAIAIRRTPVRRIPAGEHRPPRPVRSAAGTARRTYGPSPGGFAVTVYLAKYCKPDLATSRFVFHRRKPAV
jgi:hypothetical protein